jgi:hypothetical protein
MLTAMHRSSFALGTALQQSGLPFALIFGAVVFMATMSARSAWAGVAGGHRGLAALSWPRVGEVEIRKGAVLFGLTSGAFVRAVRQLLPPGGALALDAGPSSSRRLHHRAGRPGHPDGRPDPGWPGAIPRP